MDHNGSVFCICRTNRCNCVSIFYGMLAGAKLLCHKKVHKNRCFYFLLATSLICCSATAGHQDLETECWPEQNVCATKRYTKIDVFRLGKVRLGQVRLGQVRLGQVRLGQVRLGWVGLGWVGLGLVRLGQVRLGLDRLGNFVTIPVEQAFK